MPTSPPLPQSHVPLFLRDKRGGGRLYEDSEVDRLGGILPAANMRIKQMKGGPAPEKASNVQIKRVAEMLTYYMRLMIL